MKLKAAIISVLLASFMTTACSNSLPQSSLTENPQIPGISSESQDEGFDENYDKIQGTQMEQEIPEDVSEKKLTTEDSPIESETSSTEVFEESTEVFEDNSDEIKPMGTNIQRSADILDKLYAEKKSSVVMSPMSLNFALGLINNGASESTGIKINSYLGDNDFNTTVKKLLSLYGNTEEGYDKSELRKEYEKKCHDILAKYGAGQKLSQDYARWTVSFVIDAADFDDTLEKRMQDFFDSIDNHEELELELYDLMGELQQKWYDGVDETEEYRDSIDKNQGLNIANSLWVNSQKNINPDFQKTTEDIYQTDVSSVDVTNPEQAASYINKWCGEETNHLIDEIVRADDIDPDMAAVLVNTVYFNSQWMEEWHTVDGGFTDAEGKNTELEVMTKTVDNYYENEKATAFGTYYKNGLEFIGILPKDENPDFKAAGLDLKSLLDSGDEIPEKRREIIAKMPAFKYDTENRSLKNFLSDEGLESIFDDRKKPFDKILADGEPVFVSDIIQKCTMDLDRFGTEASAATAVIMKNDSTVMVEEEPEIIEVTLDRPFIYLIRELSTNQIVFAGRIADSASLQAPENPELDE